MSFPYNNDDSTVEDVVGEIKVEQSPIGDIIDSLTAMFYSIFPGLKTAEVEQDLTIMELEEDEGYIPPIGVLTAKEAADAIKKAEKAAEKGGDLFNTLSEGLADDEDVDKKLKSLLED